MLSPAQCEAEGSSSRFISPCEFINQTHKALIESGEPVATNCANQEDVFRTSLMVAIDGKNCVYLTLKDEKEINGQIIGQQIGWKISFRLKFDLFLQSGQTLSTIMDILNIICINCEDSDRLLIQTTNNNATHYDLRFQFYNKNSDFSSSDFSSLRFRYF